MALTAKQERFAQNIAMKGMNQSAAYSEAYDVSKMQQATVTSRASELALHSEVSARISVLSERATAAALKKVTLTREESMREVGELLEDAKSLGQISAGVAAAKLRAELAGHLDEKKDKPTAGLETASVDVLVKMREAIEAQIKRTRDAEDLTGGSVSAPAVPMRRVIG